MMERTLRVTGKGCISLKPNIICLSVTLKGVAQSYETAVKMSADSTEELKNAFEAAGFDKNTVKTVSFDLNTKYEGYRDENNDYKNKFVGYEYTHAVKVIFTADNSILGKAIYAISRCGSEPEFDIAYTVSDPEALKNALLAKAIEDSRVKADLLAAAAGVKTGDIKLIDYSRADIPSEIHPVRSMMLCKSSGDSNININIDPDDIKVSDTVTVEWTLL